MNALSGFMDMNAVWLILMIVLAIVEAVVPGLISIWFALGAFAALIATLVGAPVWLQVVWFFVVSLATLALTRPLAKKYINAKVQPTNADMMIGRECIATERIDNLAGTGAAVIDGKEWTARMESDDIKAEVGDKLTVLRIEGVKIIVKPAK